jgi:hypothetical protein
MEYLLKKMLVEAHQALDRANVPKTIMRVARDGIRREEVTLSVAERIDMLARKSGGNQ